MDKKANAGISRFQALRPSTRRLVQLYAALLHNAYIRGFIEGKIYEGKSKLLCVPGLNCYSCPGAIGSCPLGALQNALASAGHRAGWYVLGILLLFGVVLGRTVCGWICPFGMIQELLHKIPTPKIRKNRITRVLSLAKYAVLAVFAVAIPLWYGLGSGTAVPGFCKYICPAGTLSAVAMLAHPGNGSMFELLGALFTNKWVILSVTALVCVFCYRSFCRFICPLGAIYGLFNRFSITGVRVDAGKCNGCGACVRHCRMDVHRPGDHECIQCGECIGECSRGAISLRAGKITLKGPETGTTDNSINKAKRRGRILWGIALAILCAVLAWVNIPESSIRKAEPAAASQATGWEAGSVLEDFELTCYDGTIFRLSEARGKIVFINRWATWCAPCIAELPYFNDLYKAHEGDIAVVAVHPSMTIEDPASYAEKYEDGFLFATEGEGDPVKAIVGGTDTLPQTIVLNREGIVIYNSEKSVTPEMLESLWEKASEN